jgi:hypothetical protein
MVLNYSRNIIMAAGNSNRYSKNSYVIGQSAGKFLSPLCKDMENLQRLNARGLEGISTPYDGLRYSLLPAERLSSLLKKEEREIIGNDNFILVVRYPQHTNLFRLIRLVTAH